DQGRRDTPLDAALLVLDSKEEFANGALLPTRERLRTARVFDNIVAVGCPLGNDPIPTRGHLSDLFHSVGSERFWMISAPTYIGNSGGGIYSGTSHELLGIFSKIYTHGAIRPTVIPHMGLVTPLEEFYDWLDSAQIAEVVEGDGSAMIVLR
ncbi:MAG: trypsin-like peptidase domain-containing protein, partial [Planctomycetota bacterium]